jgi:hypothetical protein
MRKLRPAVTLMAIFPLLLLLSAPVQADGNCFEQCASSLGGDSAVDETIYQNCLNRCRNPQAAPAPVYFAALAISEADFRAGTAHGEPSRAAAEQLALQICRKNGGANCRVVNSGSGLCLALAMSTHHNNYGQDYDVNRASAAAKALARCTATGVPDCWVVAAPCSGDDPRWASPLPLPPAASNPPPVDPRTIGTWVFLVNPGYWYWQVGPHGSYTAYSQAMDRAGSHAGTFTAANGHWSRQATNGSHDEGTYTFQSPDVWVVTGQLGTGTWRRSSN